MNSPSNPNALSVPTVWLQMLATAPVGILYGAYQIWRAVHFDAPGALSAGCLFAMMGAAIGFVGALTLHSTFKAVKVIGPEKVRFKRPRVSTLVQSLLMALGCLGFSALILSFPVLPHYAGNAEVMDAVMMASLGVVALAFWCVDLFFYIHFKTGSEGHLPVTTQA